jgi:aminoglycoside phosphotransferase
VSAKRALALLHPDGYAADPHRSVVVASDAEPLRPDLDEDAVVAAPPRARAVRAALVRQGFQPVVRLAHAPDVRRSRFVFPLRGPAAAFALELIPLQRAKRAAARLLIRAGAFPWTTDVFRRPGARPLLTWLAALGAPRAGCSALVAQSWREDGEAVVFRFAEASTPDLVVKIGLRARAEATGLRGVAPSARGAGAAVPEIVTESELGGIPMVAQTFVPGRSAFESAKGSVAGAEALLQALAAWLERWNAATATTRPFNDDDAGGLVRAAAELGNHFEAQTRRITAACVGSPIPFVAAHNDLTSVNVLVNGDRELGLVDWGDARLECLPLGDLAYATADLAAAVDAYRDRLASFERGALHEIGSELLEQAARTLGLEGKVVELCLHACWLQHAASEREPGPFREILRRSLPQ